MVLIGGSLVEFWRRWKDVVMVVVVDFGSGMMVVVMRWFDFGEINGVVEVEEDDGGA